jgi:hypothetical protein
MCGVDGGGPRLATSTATIETQWVMSLRSSPIDLSRLRISPLVESVVPSPSHIVGASVRSDGTFFSNNPPVSEEKVRIDPQRTSGAQPVPVDLELLLLGYSQLFSIKPKIKVFISRAWEATDIESHPNHKFARLLYKHLKEGGIQPIMDEYDLKPGYSIGDFVSQISDPDKVDLVIILLTKRYLWKYENEPSQWIRREASLIQKRWENHGSSFIIPLLVDGDQQSSIPQKFHDLLYVDFRSEQQYEASLLTLFIKRFSLFSSMR